MSASWDYVAHHGQVGLVTMDVGGGRLRVRFSHGSVPNGQLREATIRVDELRRATDAETQAAIQRGLTRAAERSWLPRH